MTDIERDFQPGHILHNVIVGAFRANGTTFSEWCKANDVAQANARNSTYGQSSGPMGKALLTRIIDAAGRDTVRILYLDRIRAEAKRLSSNVKAAS